jgi:cytidylate kinase
VTVIAIDGPSGSGKSTVARGVAAALGLSVLDTGAMYRAVTAQALTRGFAVDDTETVGSLAESCELEVGERVVIDGNDVTETIRSDETTGAVSAVARQDRVRAALRNRQREWVAGARGSVVEGRDIGTVVFPDADLKIYLDADPDERARRRRAESGGNVDADRVATAIRTRDSADASHGRATTASDAATDAVTIDTTGRTIDDVVAEILRRARELAP